MNALALLATLAVVAAPEAERLAKDTARTTVAGHTFTAPAEWTVSVRGPATVLTPPEPDGRLALVDVEAKDADEAVKLAWAALDAGRALPPLKATLPGAPREGWTQITNYDYQTSPNEKRGVGAQARFANGRWTVLLYDLPDAVGEKRGSQVSLVYGGLRPKGYTRESFAGRRAHPLDAARLAELDRFVERGRELLGVPGVSVGLVQDGKVVFAGGYGVRELGREAKVDADTKYMIASNTKALTTLMLATLVAEKKIAWDAPATSLLPSFKLGDADTTSKVLVKHLICACTGMPRQDLEWLLEFEKVAPGDVLTRLGTMQPTSPFGALFQYSNPMAAAAGFIGGHVAHPDLELGQAYDEAMRRRVFAPLGMNSTTFDYVQAQQGNYARPHAPDFHSKPAVAAMDVNYSITPVRPTGGAWSTVRDMLRYVQMELAEGLLPDGSRYISKDALRARYAPQVAMGEDATYGMGLMVETRYGIPVVHHGGDMIGFHSDMIWLPEHGVGAVVLTNGDPGWTIRGLYRRKLLEVLFDGRPEADAALEAAAKSWFESLAAERKLLVRPADEQQAAKLAARYASPALGTLAVQRDRGVTTFDFGEWRSEAASKKNPDGTVSFVTISPGVAGFELVMGSKAGARTLVLRDAQHEYEFVEQK